jgi:hypothetical protein
VLFVTSADRPFTESERAFLETIRDWGKKVVVAVNQADILDKPARCWSAAAARPRPGSARRGCCRSPRSCDGRRRGSRRPWPARARA